jgi:hydrophobic/amphiphilic exporter-1 (mainly G- bacteria), HAE1 family
VDDVKKDVEKAAEKANKTAEVSFSLQSTTGSSPNTMSFTVKDTNNVRLTDTVVRIQNALEEIDNVTELTNDKTETVEEIQITIDRDKAFAEGLMPAQIAMILNDVTRGVTALQMTTEAEEIYNVHVSYDPSVTKDIDKIKGILIRKNDGTYIPLEDLTIIQVGEGPTSVKRVDQQSAIDFTLKYTNDTNLGDISKLVDEKIADLDLPEETEITFGGDRELLESSINSLALAFVLAIVFIYLVMAAQFESFKYPFVIMLTVPLMVIGVAIALTVTQTPLGLTAIIGLIVLAGIVVNNAIVLVDYVNQKKTEGMKTYDALVASVKDRARPILMTAFTTILGLLPLALALGEGTEVNQPMGVTVIGGLISSTFLTLFVIPVVYSFFDKQTRNLNKKYVTPDGQLIPAYLLEDRIIQDEHETEEVKEGMPNLPSKRSYNRQDMKFMLEELLKIVDEKDQGKQDEGDKDNKR